MSSRRTRKSGNQNDRHKSQRINKNNSQNSQASNGNGNKKMSKSERKRKGQALDGDLAKKNIQITFKMQNVPAIGGHREWTVLPGSWTMTSQMSTIRKRINDQCRDELGKLNGVHDVLGNSGMTTAPTHTYAAPSLGGMTLKLGGKTVGKKGTLLKALGKSNANNTNKYCFTITNVTRKRIPRGRGGGNGRSKGCSIM